ncbi:hypothetical protein BAY59_37535 [Prauserella coralliicola]|nr:hypothetical protein BAY59_37535 [Prauserella coralliicola]
MSAEPAAAYRTPNQSEIRIARPRCRQLADPVRLGTARQLAKDDSELTCGAFDVPVSKSTLTHHLRTREKAGVIGGARRAPRG